MFVKARQLTLCMLMFALSGQVVADVVAGLVSRVVDGDTIVFLTEAGAQKRVRLADIDTPELNQPWGPRAKLALEQLSLGKLVVDTDRYGRLVATLFVESENINRSLVEHGHAWVYRKYLRDPSLIPLETAAREAQIGLWRADTPIKPSDWRAGSRKTASSSVDQISRSVKKSRSGICHAAGTTYYSRTLHFQAFESLGDCLRSGGRLPKQ